MPHARRLIPCVLLLWLSGTLHAEDGIAWRKDLTTALAAAKAEKKILLVCINARFVEGREEEEPAAKGLREVVYRNPRVVQRSRAFVCALLSPSGSSADYGELRVLGVGGKLVSPQHIFIAPEGDRILHRKEYWPYGKGESAIEALLAMMDKAESALKGASGESEPPPFHEEGEGDVAPEGEARAAWIERMVRQVLEGNADEQKRALDNLVANDAKGDCVTALATLLTEHRKRTALLSTIIRALGRDGLESAALPLAGQLGHRDASVRGNAAVSLEYVGSRDKKVISALKRSAGKEKDEAIANHMYRALGRCGAKDGGVRSVLLKQAGSAKSEFASYGACIGLAYFEGDKKAARAVEKLLKKIGVPGSRRGGGQNAVKRSLVSWTLACIGDEKSATFVREELMAGLEHVRAEWVPGLVGFWDVVARVCSGERELLSGVEDGVRGAVTYVKAANLERYGAETRHLMDAYRKGRDNPVFTPRGDNILNDERQ